ncbi:hypothetical protein [Actinomadura sp. WAC 06369]|uniref:hypothetical protein n=1 Tax=Actinomadura sp. WAC 06369 TaxID=2203193 RepID=UPI000F77FEA0|nr:hypothetical protein [Actinomadura sp. WAC 06369]RSN54670.1 hypothetical protein DMH08_26760 [Actinomadura sp. WAC 06369]
MGFMADLAEPLIRRGLVRPDDLDGCTAGEIEALMAAQGVTALPSLYREFLEFGGRTPYWLARYEWDYTWLLEEAKDTAREIVVDDGLDWASFADTFVFQTHQGYLFFYFRAEDLTLPDPPYWVYRQGGEVAGGEPFSRFLQDFADALPRLAAGRTRPGDGQAPA